MHVYVSYTRKFFYIIYRCFNLFLGWLFIWLTPAFSTPAFSVAQGPATHFNRRYYVVECAFVVALKTARRNCDVHDVGVRRRCREKSMPSFPDSAQTCTSRQLETTTFHSLKRRDFMQGNPLFSTVSLMCCNSHAVSLMSVNCLYIRRRTKTKWI